MPTIPDAPPAIIPSVAVGGSSARRAREHAPAQPCSGRAWRALTSATGSHEPPSAPQRVGLQVGAERDAGDRLRGAEDVRRATSSAPRPGERDASPTTSAANR